MAEMSVQTFGPLEPEVDNPTVGKRTSDFKIIALEEDICFPHVRVDMRVSFLAVTEQGGRRKMKKLICVLLSMVLLCVCAFAETETGAVQTEAEAVQTEAETEEAEEEESGLAATSSLIAIAAVAALMAVLLILSARRVKWNASMIAKAAACIALSFLLSTIRLFRMPMGGSVTPVSLLPLILFSMAFGAKEGVLVGCAAGLLQLFVDPYVIHPIQLLVDYPMSYAAIALCCVAKVLPLPKVLRLPVGVILGYMGKFLMAVLSGVVFFAEYAGDQGALIYSLTYNFSYIWPEMLACAVIAFIPAVAKLPELMSQNNMR